MLKLDKSWEDLKFWNSGEWQVIEERLDDMDHGGLAYNPSRRLLFAALAAVPADKTRVCILGQDPYPDIRNSTGLAFDCPRSSQTPASLRNIFNEYQADLHYPYPTSSSLQRWVEQGVLLWNVYPSCQRGKPGSHHWDEWTYLTKEIVEKLDASGTVCFILLGSIARQYARYISRSPVIETSHPSPLGANHGFLGSRIFSTCNAKLKAIGQPPIDWRLEDADARGTRTKGN